MDDQQAVPARAAERPGIPSLRWEEGPAGATVVLLDQTRLPAEEVEMTCEDVPSLVRAITTLSVRGAPLLGIAGAYGIALAAARGDDVGQAAELLADARPTAVNLGYGVRRAQAAHRAALAGGTDGAGAAAAALAEARTLHREDAEAGERMAAHCLALLDELVPGRPMRILTHCNTGRLVSGGEGTAFAVALAAHRAGRLEQLWVDETRPLLQGARLTAYEAAHHGMQHTLLADNAAGSLFATGRVDAVLIGADRIAADGSVANKVGSYPLAVLARHHEVPFIVVAPMTTVDTGSPDGASIVVEQRPAQEVTEITSRIPGVSGTVATAQLAPLGTPVHNPAFDVTPPELVAAIVTERGVLRPGKGSIAALWGRSPAG
ncbi:S-methyl-5-thioribose-1-phosphate isomerase [Streptomyces meridianus]|uniref:Methylthioribose-1-phosphate isomerase n=1 Tax=Streptomyces meridianus TaxID=2938945 RepID=A0ABT0WZQ5_9ACTN|nr:S-methyl-5-thioribose-1-phosphate isomerase [Streptomyces meridianus]MCM2575753.1 S-methyl-5-thioribose-1-phosphate isomerase [Streptomyces meridianus]